ncbi:RHS repeat domain-containing protein [Empedobacter falsenii]|uniref:RHS repeat domain-containing protein n=1 Tax=Empedobacter falsenii TaxID=343874 RepID=UPI0005707F05|nr:RHS repeat-associated core domain-containing protein [Empedobacter falsenii]
MNALTDGKIAFNYVYNLTDHLGNVRVSYAWDDVNSKLKTVNEDHYYPFGLKHDGYDYVTTGNENYKYKYNGKELQDELNLNLYDYGARNYDPAIGRWFNIDPLAEKYRRWSPYTYAVNNPIRFVDPDGMSIDDPQSRKIADETLLSLSLSKTLLSLQKDLINKSSTNSEGKISLSRSQKKQINEINSKIDQINSSVNDINDMIANKDTDFVFKNASENNGAPETKRTGERKITMYFDSFGTKVHEGRHGGQIARNEYSIDSSGKVSDNFGASYEISTYKAQLSATGSIEYDPYRDYSNIENISKIRTRETVNTLGQITNTFLQSLVDRPGVNQAPIYPNKKTNKSYYAK